MIGSGAGSPEGGPKKTIVLPLLLMSALVLTGGLAGSRPAKADVLKPDFAVGGMTGPATLIPGLSGTFAVTIRNDGNRAGPLELFLIFGGTLDQAGQIRAGAGLACEIRHDAGINAALRCAGGRLEPKEETTIIVQGRGQSAGAGMLVATINPSQSLPEHDYGNNFKQLNVTIN